MNLWVAHLLAKQWKSFTNGELIKLYLITAAEAMCPNRINYSTKSWRHWEQYKQSILKWSTFFNYFYCWESYRCSPFSLPFTPPPDSCPTRALHFTIVCAYLHLSSLFWVLFLGFDEITDVIDIAQFFFIQGVNADFEVIKELASIPKLHGTTMNKNISQKSWKKTLIQYNFSGIYYVLQLLVGKIMCGAKETKINLQSL